MSPLAIAALVLAAVAWTVLLLRRSRGSSKRIDVVGSVSGVVVTADQVHGGIRQAQAPASAPPRNPPAVPSSSRLDRLKLVLGIIATFSTILGTVLAWLGLVD